MFHVRPKGAEMGFASVPYHDELRYKVNPEH